MASGTKIRALARLLDAVEVPVWAIGPGERIVYVSAATADWLQLDPDRLLDRRAVAGATGTNPDRTESILDAVAASLAAPPGLREHGSVAMEIQPPSPDGCERRSMPVRFTAVGDQADLILAVGGQTDDSPLPAELQDALQLRVQLDAWRKQHSQLATVATAGVSVAARRMRGRLRVATGLRTHVGFFGPVGSTAESIAIHVHHLSAKDELLVRVDGTLMDAELLDATLDPLVARLAESSTAVATALIVQLDEMPIEAQLRLSELTATYPQRLRLLATAGSQPRRLETVQEDSVEEPVVWDETLPTGMIDPLADLLCALVVPIEPLSSRSEDLPLLAAAMIDTRHAAGEGMAQRINRAALDALILYPWPGDYQELDAAIRHAVRSCNRSSIGLEHLPLVIRTFQVGDPQPLTPSTTSLDEAMKQFESKLIRQAVDAADGNRSEAARRLGISRARLLRRLDEAEQS